jgi:alkylhydroperoxidase/carboxymuconolactone decarboxylase family protein YurZ
MRNAVQDTGPLPQEMKSLIIGILDVATGNYDGALNHARAALAAGLPWEGLLQAYCLMWIVQGFASTWGNVGWRVIDALRLERAKETGEQPG